GPVGRVGLCVTRPATPYHPAVSVSTENCSYASRFPGLFGTGPRYMTSNAVSCSAASAETDMLMRADTVPSGGVPTATTRIMSPAETDFVRSEEHTSELQS